MLQAQLRHLSSAKVLRSAHPLQLSPNMIHARIAQQQLWRRTGLVSSVAWHEMPCRVLLVLVLPTLPSHVSCK